MKEIFERTALLFGAGNMEKLHASHVAVFGIGGVGGHAAEALVRSGIGEITIVDSDTVSLSNINRQIIARVCDVGRKKTDVMEERLLSINPELRINKYDTFFLPGMENELPFSSFSFIIDAVDTVAAKLALAEIATSRNIPLISSMGAGNKVHPELFRISDIFSTDTDPLARVMRRELKKRGIGKLTVVWSPETPVECGKSTDGRRPVPGSNAFTPSAAGLIAAGHVVRSILEIA